MFAAHTVRDQVSFLTTARDIRTPAFKVIERVQDTRPGDQIIATAVALVAMCEATGMDVRQVLVSAERVLNDADSPYCYEIGAIREYARNEILRKPQ